MSDKPMTLQDAAERTGKSIPTLRRRIKDGTLVPEPRRSDHDPYELRPSRLEAAGFAPAPATADQRERDTRRERDDYRQQLDECEEERRSLEGFRARCLELETLVAEQSRSINELVRLLGRISE